MISSQELEAAILHNLARKRKWGHSHTNIGNVTKSIPPHLGKQAKEAAGTLIKQGLILAKPTSYGLEISLNPERAEEIKEKILRSFGQ